MQLRLGGQSGMGYRWSRYEIDIEQAVAKIPIARIGTAAAAVGRGNKV
jgi:hypothetical protein